MQRNLHSPMSLAPGWPGLLRMLAFLVLGGGLLWSSSQVHAIALPATGDELAHFIVLDTVSQSAVLSDAGEACRKPAPVKVTAVERVLNEVGDLEVLPHRPVWLPAVQSAPVPGPQPALTEAQPRPLLRPPARLG